MKSCMEIILSRRSVKKYLPDMPNREDIDKIIEAGLAAASGRNKQAPVIVAVTNKEIRDALSKANADVMGASGDPFYGAPCVLVVLGEKIANTYVYDGSITLGNMMLAAHALGLGSTWLARLDTALAAETLGLPASVTPYAMLPIGYPALDAPASPNHGVRKPLSDTVTYL